MKKLLAVTTALAISASLTATADAATYKVKVGDTLWSISNNYGTSVSAVKAANGLSTNVIHVGQKLSIGSKVKNTYKAKTYKAPALKTATRQVSSSINYNLNWAALAQCESGGNASINTGNGFYGLYQFDLQTWYAVGGKGLPSNASAAEQTKRAQILYNQRGSQPWPVCGARL